MLNRFLALIVAVGLVAGATELRSRWDGAAAEEGGRAAGTVVCVTELAAVCEALMEAGGGDLTAVVQEAGDTLEALSGPDAPAYEAWLTLQPWPQMARDRRERAGLPPLLGDDSDVLGRSSVAMAVWADRLAVLEDHCGTVTWKCVGEVAGGAWSEIGGDERWGPVKPGHGHPVRGASGLLALHQAVESQFGSGFSATDLQDPALFGWLAGLERAVPAFPSSGSPVRTMVQFGKSRYDVVGVIEAEATDLLREAGERAGDLEVIPAPPPVAAEVVVVSVGDGHGVARRVADEAAELLQADGWTAGPSEAGAVPRPGALEALRRTAGEVIR